MHARRKRRARHHFDRGRHKNGHDFPKRLQGSLASHRFGSPRIRSRPRQQLGDVHDGRASQSRDERQGARPRPQRRGRHARERERQRPGARGERIHSHRHHAHDSGAARSGEGRHRQPLQPLEEHRALRDLRLRQEPHEPVRGNGLSTHHLLARPPGRAREVHGHDPRAQGALSSPSLERQPGRIARPPRRAPRSPLGRPLSETLLPLRARRGHARVPPREVPSRQRPRSDA